jgi:hypothetical protein
LLDEIDELEEKQKQKKLGKDEIINLFNDPQFSEILNSSPKPAALENIYRTGFFSNLR